MKKQLTLDRPTRAIGLSYDEGEVLFDITWTYALWHEQQSEETRERIIDYYQGSRGLYEHFVDETKKFQASWNDDGDYYERIDTATTNMIAAIAASIM